MCNGKESQNEEVYREFFHTQICKALYSISTVLITNFLFSNAASLIYSSVRPIDTRLRECLILSFCRLCCITIGMFFSKFNFSKGFGFPYDILL